MQIQKKVCTMDETPQHTQYNETRIRDTRFTFSSKKRHHRKIILKTSKILDYLN